MTKIRRPILILMLFAALFSGFLSVNASSFLQEEETETPTAEETEMTEEAEETEPVDPPGVPKPVYPIDSEITELAGFYWTPAENADHYQVSWQSSDGTQGTAELSASDGTCTLGRCTTYEQLPSDGSYTWTVTAINEAGDTASDEAAFTVRIGIPTPEAYRPNTTISRQRSVTFEWEDAGGSVSAYRIQTAVRETGQILMDLIFPTDMLWIGNGICYLETDIYLSEGNYSWRVQGLNNGEASGWSAWVDFQVNCPDCLLGTYLNATTAGLYPNGSIPDQSPAFIWLSVTGATYYKLSITGPEGDLLPETQIPASECSFYECSFTPELTLSEGQEYSWTVSAYGGMDARWGTDERTFRFAAPQTVEEAITFTAPEENGSLDPEIPLIIWSDPGETAASFRIDISDEGGNPLFYGDLTRDEAWCDGLTCSIVFMEIPEGGSYTLSLTPLSASNLPGETVSLTFAN